ncbi:MAG: transporter [Deltaproteobacteria bacterium]|nr:transporter [Deltaproteobacteria bacterium]
MKNFTMPKTIWLFLAMVLACSWTLAVSPTLAQVPGVPFELPGPPEKKEECPSTFGPIITDTAIPIEKGKFAVQPTFGLSFVTSNFSPNWRRVSAGGNFGSFNMSWKFTYGLINNLEVYTVIPFIANWANSVNEPGPNGERGARFQGLGDLSFTLKYRLVEETEKLPTVSAIFTPTFPTGHFRHLNPSRLGQDIIGGGAYVFTTGLNMSKWVKPFIFYGNLWYSMATDFTNDDGRQHPRDFVTVNLAAEYPITGKWVACVELTSTWDGGRLFGHKSNVPPAALLSLSPQLQYMYSEKLSFSFGVNCDLAGKNTTANITPLLSMVYAF